MCALGCSKTLRRNTSGQPSSWDQLYKAVASSYIHFQEPIATSSWSASSAQNNTTDWHTMIARTSSTRTRRGGSCLKDIYIYKTFLIYRTCMRRAPAKPVRACTLRKWCPVAHVTFEAPLRTSHFSLHSSHSTLHTALFTLHTAFFALHTSHLKLHSPHFSLLTAFFTLHTSHCALHTSHWALVALSQIIASHVSSKFSWITSQYCY